MCKFGSGALEWMPFNVLYFPKVHASLPKDFNTAGQCNVTTSHFLGVKLPTGKKCYSPKESLRF